MGKVSSSKDSALLSQRSRNYKFKVGAGNSGVNLLGHSTVAGPGTNNNYNMGGANFGLGAIGNLGNLGGYLTKNGNASSNMSAYATNASDLIRGFKSSQSIPVVTSQQ